MTQWLCDTNVLSELMCRRRNQAVVDWVSEQESLFVSVITVDEIYAGLAKGKLEKKRAWFDRLLKLRCVVLPIDEQIAKRAGEIRGRFLADGITRAQADMLIAATAWRFELSISTRNTPNFDGCGVPLLNPFG